MSPFVVEDIIDFSTVERAIMRRLLAVLIVVVGPVAGEAQQDPAPSPEPGSLFLYPERIPLESGKFAHAERGLLFVPTNRSDPNSKVLGVEIYRFPASEQADSATPPLFRLHGGPGFPGLQPSLANDGYYERDIQPFLDIADLIVVGQRGIGYSKPNTICEPGNRLSQRCRDYWETAGVDLKGFTVVEAAADVRDVAIALGYGKIQLTGESFGSHWGITVSGSEATSSRSSLIATSRGPTNEESRSHHCVVAGTFGGPTQS